MTDSEKNNDILPQRLCSEVQLFDLCDLEKCHHKIGNFCTDPLLLSRFEKISEDEIRSPERYISGEIDEDDDGEGFHEEDGELEADSFDDEEDDY